MFTHSTADLRSQEKTGSVSSLSCKESDDSDITVWWHNFNGDMVECGQCTKTSLLGVVTGLTECTFDHTHQWRCLLLDIPWLIFYSIICQEWNNAHLKLSELRVMAAFLSTTVSQWSIMFGRNVTSKMTKIAKISLINFVISLNSWTLPWHLQ